MKSWMICRRVYKKIKNFNNNKSKTLNKVTEMPMI